MFSSYVIWTEKHLHYSKYFIVDFYSKIDGSAGRNMTDPAW